MLIILVLLFTFISIFLLTLNFFESKSDKIIANRVKSAIEIMSIEFKKIDKPQSFYNKVIIPLIKKLAKFNSRLKLEKVRGEYKNKLFLADLEYQSQTGVGFNVDEFLALKELSFLAVFILYPVLLSFDIFYMIVFGILAFFLPDLWLKEKIATKRKAILRSLPDSLDLLVVCVEAGLTFDSALNRLVEKIKEGPLKSEFSKMLYEVKIGKSRYDALKDMTKRVQINDFSSFVNSIIQSEKLGVSLGKTLRNLSDELRIKRRQRAEKLAMEAPVKLLFPLLIFIFPTVFIMLFGPIVLRLLATFK